MVLMGKIFVMGGGSDFRKILSSCEIYDPGADKWSYGKGKYCKTLRESQGRLKPGPMIILCIVAENYHQLQFIHSRSSAISKIGLL